MQPGYQYPANGQPQYGQPAQPGYGYGGDPYAQGYGYDPEEAEKAAKKQQKQQERLIRREKRVAREQAEGNSFVKWLCVATCFTSLLTTATMFGDSWASTSFVGAGVKMFSISTSLFQIVVDIKCGKNWLEDKLCTVIQKMDGTHSLHDAQQISCSLSDHSCGVMDRLYYASFIIFFCHTIALLCDLGAALFLYFYWNGSPLEKVRSWALGFFFSAPLSIMVGLIAWTCVIPDLGQLPMAWTHTTSALTGGYELFGYKEVPTFAYGWCWILSWITCILMMFQVCAWTFCFREHQDQDMETAREELEKLMVHDPALLEQMQHNIGASSQPQPQQQQYPASQTYGSMQQPYGAGSYQTGAAVGMPPGAGFGMPPAGGQGGW